MGASRLKSKAVYVGRVDVGCAANAIAKTVRGPQCHGNQMLSICCAVFWSGVCPPGYFGGALGEGPEFRFLAKWHFGS